MQIELRPICQIRPYEYNPRLNAAAVDAVVASLKEFGWRQPIVVDADGVIVVGHTRYLAAEKMGLAEVPVHVARDFSPAQAPTMNPPPQSRSPWMACPVPQYPPLAGNMRADACVVAVRRWSPGEERHGAFVGHDRVEPVRAPAWPIWG